MGGVAWAQHRGISRVEVSVVTGQPDHVPPTRRSEALGMVGAQVIGVRLGIGRERSVDAAEFISACSCFGLTGSVTTAPAPTVTVTTTVDYCEDI